MYIVEWPRDNGVVSPPSLVRVERGILRAYPKTLAESGTGTFCSEDSAK